MCLQNSTASLFVASLHAQDAVVAAEALAHESREAPESVDYVPRIDDVSCIHRAAAVAVAELLQSGTDAVPAVQ